MQAAQSRPFGRRRVPPPLPPAPPPENPAVSWVRLQVERHRSRLQDAARSARPSVHAVSAWAYTLASAGVPLSGMALAGSVALAKSAFRCVFGRAQTLLQRLRPIAIRRPTLPARSNPLLEAIAYSWRGLFVRTLAYLCGLAVLSLGAAEVFKSAPVVAAVEPEMRPAWIAVGKPYPAFHLTLPEMQEDPHYAIRRHAEGGGRKDILSWGEPGQSPRNFMIEVYRPGGEFDGFASPAADTAARAADLAPASRMRESLPIETKFGALATVDFNFGPGGAGHCIGFARAFHEPRLQISGLSCNRDALVDRASVACALDRLTLMSAGSDPDIAKLFAQAELKRNFCGQRDPILYATPRRAIDPGKPLATELRGRLAR